MYEKSSRVTLSRQKRETKQNTKPILTRYFQTQWKESWIKKKRGEKRKEFALAKMWNFFMSCLVARASLNRPKENLLVWCMCDPSCSHYDPFSNKALFFFCQYFQVKCVRKNNPFLSAPDTKERSIS